jgi:VWFA-related protein
MKRFIAACATAAAAVSVHAARDQDQPPQEPKATFRTAVDLVPVDVSVIDRDGRPVDDLKPEDFVLTVDGKPRRIASAEFIRLGGGEAVPAPPPYYSTNAKAAGGRLIMLIVDQGSIAPGGARVAIEAAARFIDRLNPSDRLALFVIPGAGPQIDFTANHTMVRAMLKRIVGQAQAPIGPHRVGISEALRVDRGDELAMMGIIDRECAGFRVAAEIAACREAVAAAAREAIADVRNQTRNSILSLRYIMERLAETRTPKTVIYMAEGLVIDRDFAELSWFPSVAARGQVSLYVLQIDSKQFDATSSRVSPSRLEDLAVAEEGLSLMAGLARGAVFRVVSNADYAFNRLSLEISAYYLLSFEPEAGDRDGKAHKIKIEIPARRNVAVRARGEFTVDPPRAHTDEEFVVETLRSPLLASEIGLKVATYTFRDPDSQKLRILFAAEIDRSLNPSGRLAAGYALVDARANTVASHFEPEVKSSVSAPTRTQQFVGAADAPGPGVYVMKLAVVDSAGRRGSVEHSFRAQLTSAGQIRATDLMIAEVAPTTSQTGLVPAVAAEFTTDTLHGYLELYSDSPEALGSTEVTLEVAEGEDGRALDSAPVEFTREEGPSRRRVAEGAVPIALLPPGDYVARAVITVGGRRAGVVTRPFRIARAAATVAAPGTSAPAARGARTIPFSSRIDAFERRAVLAPQVVGFFLDRMNAGSGTSSAAATEHARAGRFDEAAGALDGGSVNPLAAAFLQGLALYAKGDLEAAAVKFRETLRLDSEFFPAAFYLGACYAAGGRDREAAAAWQTSLVTESDAPFIYTLLADALLRQRHIDQALDILNEAASIWPDSPEVQQRLGTAFSMAGRAAEALKVLEPYLAAHPGDHERHFLALRTLYEAAAAGRPIASAADDLARFERYATAYAAAGGPQQAIVEQWRKYMKKD